MEGNIHLKYFFQGTTSSFVGCMAFLELVVKYQYILATSSPHDFLGHHCCLWCLIGSTSLKVPRTQRQRSPSRTLDGLKEDYARFCASGGNLDNAKFYNNVIGTNILDIPIDQVHLSNHMIIAEVSFFKHRYAYLAYT